MTNRDDGSIIVSILIITTFLVITVFALLVLSSANLARARGRVFLLQAQYAAESGADSAVAALNGGNTSYTGTTSAVTILTAGQYKSTYTSSVADGSNGKEKIVTAEGKVYVPAKATTARYSRRIKVTVQRSSTTTSSSMVSRNIVDVQSGVKNISAKDIYVNGYINMSKNTTNLIAENIIVAGKNTGAGNCSIGGTGNLVKPTTFSDPAQTKTNITVGYNNCINPPSNATNANFTVLANQSNISTIQSTYIPWSQYMDSSYLNANSCNDWTTGTSPRTIPSTGNTKKTHYPDSGSNVATTCGTSGSLNLGSTQFNITDNVHVRANLCSSSACTPTFNNPTATIKFIFVEGSVNFDRVTTTSTSGPVVIVSYGTDPSSKSGACPYGGAVYVGSNGNTSAADLYLLASNGICLDKTKFGSSPALGGLSGKNIYIATNPGTPFDLKLDPLFPSEQIPVDLSWRAVRYQRL
jgi:hypothetical protein